MLYLKMSSLRFAYKLAQNRENDEKVDTNIVDGH